MVSVCDQVKIYLSRAGLVQQEYEVHTKVQVRVAIDALDYEYNHDARTQSPRLTAARLQLAVGRRRLGPREQGEQRTRLSWLRTMRESTQSSSSRAGIGFVVEKKYHVKRLGTSLRGQTTRILSVGLNARAQGRAKCTRRGV